MTEPDDDDRSLLPPPPPPAEERLPPPLVLVLVLVLVMPLAGSLAAPLVLLEEERFLDASKASGGCGSVRRRARGWGGVSTPAGGDQTARAQHTSVMLGKEMVIFRILEAIEQKRLRRELSREASHKTK